MDWMWNIGRGKNSGMLLEVAIVGGWERNGFFEFSFVLVEG